MPKASFAKEDMYAPSGRGFVETVGSKKLGEVVDVVARYHQWQANKTTGAQSAPLTSVMLSIAEIDASGNRIAEPVEQELVVERTPKDGSMIRVRPGLAESRGDDAVDTAENGEIVLGTEGKSLFVEEGTKLSMRSGFGVFVVSCQDQGFKNDILSAGFLPDFIGMRAWFDLKAGSGKKADGTAYTDFVVDKITKFPYEKAAAAASAGAPKSTAAAKGKANGAAKGQATATVPTTATPAASGSSDDLDTICLNALRAVSTEHAASANSSATLTRQKIYTTAMTKILSPKSGVPAALHKPAVDLLKNATWFAENAIAFGAVNSGDDAFMLIGMEG